MAMWWTSRTACGRWPSPQFRRLGHFSFTSATAHMVRMFESSVRAPSRAPPASREPPYSTVASGPHRLPHSGRCRFPQDRGGHRPQDLQQGLGRVVVFGGWALRYGGH